MTKQRKPGIGGVKSAFIKQFLANNASKDI